MNFRPGETLVVSRLLQRTVEAGRRDPDGRSRCFRRSARVSWLLTATQSSISTPRSFSGLSMKMRGRRTRAHLQVDQFIAETGARFFDQFGRFIRYKQKWAQCPSKPPPRCARAVSGLPKPLQTGYRRKKPVDYNGKIRRKANLNGAACDRRRVSESQPRSGPAARTGAAPRPPPPPPFGRCPGCPDCPGAACRIDCRHPDAHHRVFHHHACARRCAAATAPAPGYRRWPDRATHHWQDRQNRHRPSFPSAIHGVRETVWRRPISVHFDATARRPIAVRFAPIPPATALPQADITHPGPRLRHLRPCVFPRFRVRRQQNGP